jgi:2-keto-4-pentenoate hydratase/2-oxohepta-3-ene-1,7-dioic acid hydratase in catechol pathway
MPVGERILDLLRSGPGPLIERATEILAGCKDAIAADGVRLLAPIPDPPTVRDFMTFESHFAGTLLMKGPDTVVPHQWYRSPAFYFSNPYGVIGPSDDVAVPPGCRLFDLELEVAAVIGEGGRDLSPDDAEDHIAGYTILIDWSARDIQFREMEVGLGPTKGKDSATTLGPALVTSDELAPFRSGTSFDLTMSASVNGVPVGADSMDHMAWSFGEMISYASRGTEIRPGDVFGSGTCGGGCLAEIWGRQGFDARRGLQPGDLVEVTVEQLGSLACTVVAGREPIPLKPRTPAG